ncbi:SsrA-binding protein SmpB [bacterium]|nr:SsrA-binding protein SmpB [bacterium]
MDENTPMRVVAKNRKAWHEYTILQKFEAGISLKGVEVKSVRDGHIALTDAYAAFEGGELYLNNLNIGAYRNKGYTDHDERRPRKLLLHRRELLKIARQIEIKGNTIIPLQVYFKGPRLKVEIAVATGKRQYDKREAKEKARMDREMQREIKNRLKHQ